MSWRTRLFCGCILLVNSIARAEMTEVTVAASVRSFDLKTVVIQVNKTRLRVPRGLIKQSSLREGEAILVTFRGDEIKLLFPNSVAKTDRSPGARVPASYQHK